MTEQENRVFQLFGEEVWKGRLCVKSSLGLVMDYLDKLQSICDSLSDSQENAKEAKSEN
jgi:hypothetical protein